MLTLSRKEQTALDRALFRQAGLSPLLLTEGAAHSLCRFILSHFPLKQKIRLFAGAGKNGGDAYALARLLSAFYDDVKIYETEAARERHEREEESAAAQMRKILFAMQCPPEPVSRFVPVKDALLIDGLFGTGFDASRGICAELRETIAAMERSRACGSTILAVDLPSGVDADTGEVCEGAVKADFSLSFVCPKRGMLSYPGRAHCGEIAIADLGIPAEVLRRCWPDADDVSVYGCDSDFVKSLRIERKKEAHKNCFGRLLVVAGSGEMPGAALLAVRAALRSGTGITECFSRPSVIAKLSSVCPEVLLSERSGEAAVDFARFKEKAARASACLIGPGLGREQELRAWIEWALREVQTLILDADALNLMSEEPDRFHQLCLEREQAQLPPVVLTPHPGEFGRLWPELQGKSRIGQALLAARHQQAIVVLKGAATLIAFPRGKGGLPELWINTSGNNGLAKGGSGDVLAGMIAALLAQKPEEPRMVAAAVWLHGAAADLCAEQKGERSLLPSELIETLPAAFSEAEW